MRFQSLLSWITPTNSGWKATCGDTELCFNPCCPGSRPPTPRVQRFRRTAPGFNPCCPGSRPPTRPPVGPATNNVSFNPCCPGSRPPTGPRDERRLHMTSVVSILVVLDHAHQRHEVADHHPTPLSSGFNPCCPGSRPPTRTDVRHAASPADPPEVFQSLLSWITPTNARGRRRPQTPSGSCCFNPCCPGSRPPTPELPRARAVPSLISFNPCCPGSRPPTVRRELTPSRGRLGFNPCCPGSRPPTYRTSRPWPRTPLERVFQSLLSWITPTNATFYSPLAPTRKRRFQSLLSWITPTNSASSEGYCGPASIDLGFNPCCPGSRPPTASDLGRLRPSKQAVSFNPCCPGSRPPTSESDLTYSRTRRHFNPCCPGSRPPTARLDLAYTSVVLQVSILVVLDHAHQRLHPL